MKSYSTNSSYQAWMGKTLKLDLTPPWLTITNPVANIISQPIIELQGYSAEPLDSISYDITNALGLVTNQQVLILKQFYDTNVWDYTTNMFQAFDVSLTNGPNVITLHATDLAGNVMTTNLSYTLDYSSKTNPPVVQIYWPQDGTAICGSSFTWRGHLDDFTETVAAQMVDSNGNTNIFEGVVERNGNFWVENLPISSGTTAWTLTVTDAAGNVSQTNISVSAGDVGLTITPVSDANQLWNPSITVDGTIGDAADYTVWVNGVKANYTGGGAWEATNVYLPVGGTAVIQARAIPNSQNGGNGTGGGGGGPVGYDNLGNPDPPGDQDAESAPDRPTRIYQATYNRSVTYSTPDQESSQWTQGSDSSQSQYNEKWTFKWNDTGPDTWGSGSGNESLDTQGSDSTICGGNTENSGHSTEQISWPEGIEVDTGDAGSSTNYYISPGNTVESYHCQAGANSQLDLKTGQTDEQGYGCFVAPELSSSSESRTYCQRHEDAAWILETGGKGVPGQENLWRIFGGAADIPVTADTLYGYPWSYRDGLGVPIPSQQITVMGQQLNIYGYCFTVLPDDATFDVTPKVNGHDFYAFTPGAAEYLLRVKANGVILDPGKVVDGAHFCVGQYIRFEPTFTAASLGAQSVFPRWAFGGTFVNTNVPPQYPDGCPDFYAENPVYLQNETTHAWWTSGGYSPVTYTAKLGEGITFPDGYYLVVTAKGQFNMHRPRLVNYTQQAIGASLVHDHDVGEPAPANDPDERLEVYPSTQYYFQVDSLFSGTAWITQTLNGYATNSSIGQDTYGSPYLDNIDPYNGDHPISGGTLSAGISFYDAPNITCDGNTIDHRNFDDFIRFQPGGAGSIPVTLGTLSWHVHTSTSLSTIPGTGYQDYTPFPITGSWPIFVPIQEAAYDTGLIDAEAFPYWLHIVTNIGSGN